MTSFANSGVRIAELSGASQLACKIIFSRNIFARLYICFAQFIVNIVIHPAPVHIPVHLYIFIFIA